MSSNTWYWFATNLSGETPQQLEFWCFLKSHTTKGEKKVFCSCCIPFKWQPVYRCPCQESNIPKENLTISFSFKITLVLLQSTSALLWGNWTTLLFFHVRKFSFLQLTQKIKQLCIRFNWHNHLLMLLRPRNNLFQIFSKREGEELGNLRFVSPSVTTHHELEAQCRKHPSWPHIPNMFPTCSTYYLFLIPKVFPHLHGSKSALNSGSLCLKSQHIPRNLSSNI